MDSNSAQVCASQACCHQIVPVIQLLRRRSHACATHWCNCLAVMHHFCMVCVTSLACRAGQQAFQVCAGTRLLPQSRCSMRRRARLSLCTRSTASTPQARRRLEACWRCYGQRCWRCSCTTTWRRALWTVPASAWVGFLAMSTCSGSLTATNASAWVRCCCGLPTPPASRCSMEVKQPAKHRGADSHAPSLLAVVRVYRAAQRSAPVSGFLRSTWTMTWVIERVPVFQPGFVLCDVAGHRPVTGSTSWYHFIYCRAVSHHWRLPMATIVRSVHA